MENLLIAIGGIAFFATAVYWIKKYYDSKIEKDLEEMDNYPFKNPDVPNPKEDKPKK